MIQLLLIEKLLMPLAVQVCKIPAKVRNAMFQIAACSMFAVIFADNAGLPAFRYLYKFTVNCLAFGVMILMLLQPDIKPLLWSKKMTIPWFATGAVILIAGVTQSVDYLPEAALFLVGYPIFYLVAGNMPYEQVFRKFHLASDIAYVAFLLISLLFFPITGAKYSAFFDNQNGVCFYLLVPVSFGIAGIFSGESTLWKRSKDYLFTGTAIAIIFCTNSRTGLLSAIGACCAGFVMACIISGRERIWALIGRGIIVVCCVAVCIPGIIIGSSLVRSILPESPGSSSNDNWIKPGEILEQIDVINQDKYESDVSINQLTTGRWQIWKSYLAEIGLWGHDVDYRFSVNLGPEYEYKGELILPTAHMTILQFAYNYGFLAGAGYFLLNVIGGLKSLRFAWIKRGKAYNIFPTVMAIAFAGVSLFSSCVNSMIYIITFYYYISLSPLIKKE